MGISQRQVAERAGVDPTYVGRLVDLGALVPARDATFSEGDARRARLFRGLERSGLPIETVLEALDRGELSFAFLDVPVYDRFAALSRKSFREVSAQEAIPLELLLVVREAIGFAHAAPDDRMRDDELRVVPILKLQLTRGLDPGVIGQWLRVCGDTLRRLTETEADWWRTEVQLPSLASGLSEVEMLEAAAEWGQEFASPMDQALLAIYHANQEHTWTENLLGEVEDALDRAGLWDRVSTTPAIGFLDISGYTRLTEERGDRAAAELVTRLATLVQRPSDRHGGKIVKLLGDGVMLHFRDPGNAVAAALEMLEALSAASMPPAHIGVDTGPVVFQGGDYFGRTVNVAARITERAQPGQVLVSQEVVDRVGSGDVAFTVVGSFALKGVSQPVRLHLARRRA
ncbi:MAG TPA: adenylate/guanylate cyclase domain-containing protein [Actinomycetota bacterium]